MSKTRVEIRKTGYHTILVKGDEGYIDGYVVNKDGTPCAVVVVGQFIDVVPLVLLRVISDL